MTEKKLYALTDSEASELRQIVDQAQNQSLIDQDGATYEDLTYLMVPLNTPLDRDAAVERIARGLSEHWRDMHTNEALGQQRMLARAALDALLGGSNPEDRTYTREDIARTWADLDAIPSTVKAITDKDGDRAEPQTLRGKRAWVFTDRSFHGLPVSPNDGPFMEVLENE